MISVWYVKPLEKWITISFVASLTLISAFGGCALTPKARKVDLDWEFREKFGAETRACLKEEDVMKLRDALLSCGVEE